MCVSFCRFTWAFVCVCTISEISSLSPVCSEFESEFVVDLLQAETPNLLILSWFPWGPAPIPEPTQSHLIRTRDTAVTWEIPRGLGALVRNWEQKLTCIFYY